MRQKGTHTWDIVVQYYRCPNCGYILESRSQFEQRLGKNEKDLVCPRCSHTFTIVKPRKRTFSFFRL